jgi:hypothetical protein
MSVNYYVAQNQNLTIKAKSFTIQNGILYRFGQNNKFNLGSFDNTSRISYMNNKRSFFYKHYL